MSLLKLFKKTREEEKQIAINGILKELFNHYPTFTPIEQTEIINRVQILFISKQKENLSGLLKEAREVRDSMKDINI